MMKIIKWKKIKRAVGMIGGVILFYFYKIKCMFEKKNENGLWLISERGIDARDNGVYLFKYIKESHPEINVKYVISPDSPDYKKIANYSKDIILYKSKEHYKAFVTADVLISTHIWGFSPDKELFVRLNKLKIVSVPGKKIFLQHGIIKDNLDINPHIHGIDLFISGAQREYEYLLNE